MLLTRLRRRVRRYLDANGSPGPFGVNSEEIALGERLDGLAKLGELEPRDDDPEGTVVGADLIMVPDPLDILGPNKNVGDQIRQIVAAGGSGGDMLAATYDPTNVAGDAFARANHTGTQLAATISDFASAALAAAPAEAAASDTVAGVAELATQTEVNAGSDTTRIVTPATLAAYSGLLPTVPTTGEVSGPTNFTATTPTLVPGMTLTPGLGVYLVMFDCDLDHGTNGEVVDFETYINGVGQGDQRQWRRGTGQGDIRTLPSVTGRKFTVPAGQAIEIRASVAAGTAVFGNRHLTLLPVGA
jgi:hypothetical protein